LTAERTLGGNRQKSTRFGIWNSSLKINLS